jgi:negative regulator of sigma E activity
MTDTDLEQRLRAALAARAGAVTHRDLRHESAPAQQAERRDARARWWLPMAAGLAAAAVSVTAFALLRPVDRMPDAPAGPATPSEQFSPAPQVSPSPLLPSFPLVTPSRAGAPASTPSRSGAPLPATAPPPSRSASTISPTVASSPR